MLEKFTFTFLKLSVLFLYRRIFISNDSFRIANNVLIVLTALWGLTFFLAEAVIYLDSSHVAHPGESQRWSLLWFSITDVLGDIAILAMPYPCIRKLQMSRKLKIGVSIVFLLGTL